MEMPKETVARARTESRIDYLVISPDIQVRPFHIFHFFRSPPSLDTEIVILLRYARTMRL